MPMPKKRVQKACTICGKMFETIPSRVDKQATCLSDECKKAIINGAHNPFYGRQHSESTKARIGDANSKPRIEVDCTCGCGEKVTVKQWRTKRNTTSTFFVDQRHLFTWLQGENHWNYRGGRIFYGDSWEKTAQAIRERDKVCQQCGKTPEQNGRALDVHHVNPARISGDNSPDNLIALCMSCHHKINVLEQYKHPHKRGKYRVCIVCDQIFIPEPFQKICSDECRRKRQRQWEKNTLAKHPENYLKRRQRIKRWQQTNKDHVNELHRQGRERRRQ